MEIGIILAILFLIIVGLSIYTKTKRFRESRERVLIHSSEFQTLGKMGFRTERISNKTFYVGEFNNYSLVIFIDPDDVMANSNFSIVFSVAYLKFDKETFKRLNSEYYNRLKSLLMNSENLFFYEDFAQFRYANSTMRIPKNKILSKLKFITKILEKEKIKPREMADIRTLISRDYE